MKTISRILSFVSLAISGFLFVRPRLPGGFILWVPKLLAGALSPFVALVGAAGAGLGLLANAPVSVLAGAAGALASVRYVRRAVAPHMGFDLAFGQDWQQRLEEKTTFLQRRAMLPRRWSWQMPAAPEPHWERDIPFYTDPQTGRSLLCDLWLPPTGVEPSGLAFIYLHGSAWYLLDKDLGTRTFFRHLNAQGHVVMDANYRLAPEANLVEMVGDVKRAVAWMKANGPRFGVDPERIVLGGGSAGGHLALMAAYTAAHTTLTPPELQGRDLSVCGVVSEYGPADLKACYYHTQQDKTTRQLDQRNGTPFGPGLSRVLEGWLGSEYQRLGFDKPTAVGAFCNLLGGHPEEAPEQYDLVSPIHHAGPGSPPTLLIQGEDDMISPVMATRALYGKLASNRVPALIVTFPQTDHAFDLFLPRFSPAAQAALYDIERFLALVQ